MTGYPALVIRKHIFLPSVVNDSLEHIMQAFVSDPFAVRCAEYEMITGDRGNEAILPDLHTIQGEAADEDVPRLVPFWLSKTIGPLLASMILQRPA